jgi:opacity protein-like surface antigen
MAPFYSIARCRPSAAVILRRWFMTASVHLAVICGGFLGPAPVSADEWAAPQDNRYEWGVAGGFATGNVLHVKRESISFSQLLFSLAVRVGPKNFGPFNGSPAVVAEGVPFFSIDQKSERAYGVGLNILLRYALGGDRWRGVLDGGAGLLSTDIEVPAGESKDNFTPQIGGGIRYRWTPRLSLGLTYRFHHISNNGRTKDNPGINSHLVMLGLYR